MIKRVLSTLVAIAISSSLLAQAKKESAKPIDQKKSTESDLPPASKDFEETMKWLSQKIIKFEKHEITLDGVKCVNNLYTLIWKDCDISLSSSFETIKDSAGVKYKFTKRTSYNFSLREIDPSKIYASNYDGEIWLDSKGKLNRISKEEVILRRESSTDGGTTFIESDDDKQMAGTKKEEMVNIVKFFLNKADDTDIHKRVIIALQHACEHCPKIMIKEKF